MFLQAILTFVAGGTTVIILEILGLQALLAPVRTFLESFFNFF